MAAAPTETEPLGILQNHVMIAETLSTSFKSSPTIKTVHVPPGNWRRRWEMRGSHTHLLGPGDLRPLGRCCFGRAARRVSKTKNQGFILCFAERIHVIETPNHCKDRKTLLKTDTAKHRCHFIPVYAPPLLQPQPPRLLLNHASSVHVWKCWLGTVTVPFPYHNTGEPAFGVSQTQQKVGLKPKLFASQQRNFNHGMRNAIH